MQILPCNNPKNEKKFIISLSKTLRTVINVSTLKSCGIWKTKGVSTFRLLEDLLIQPFKKKSLYREVVLEKKSEIQYRTYSRFLACEGYNWEKLLFLCASRVIIKLKQLTSTDRQVLVVDDSLSERPRSKEVEHLATVFDHNDNEYKKGFRLLNIGFTDGYTFIPVFFSLLGSIKNSKNVEREKWDMRTMEGKRRARSLSKGTEVMLEGLKQAVSLGVRYVAYDSWFGKPGIIERTAQIGYDVVCMVKSNTQFIYNENPFTIERLYSQLDKSSESCSLSLYKDLSKVSVIGSIVVSLPKSDRKVRLVYCRMKKQKKGVYTVLLSTDLELSSAEILHLYAKRWSIETFFEACKQLLFWDKDTRTTNYDVMTACKTICFLRYILLSVQQRYENDWKTFSDWFYAVANEIEDLSVLHAVWEMLLLVKERAQVSQDVIEEYFNIFISKFSLRTRYALQILV